MAQPAKRSPRAAARSTARSRTTTKRTPPKKKSSSLKRYSFFSVRTGFLFALLFAAIGAFLLYRSQAAPVPVDQNLFGASNNGGSVESVIPLHPSWYRMQFAWGAEQNESQNSSLQVNGKRKTEVLLAKSNGIKVMGLLAYSTPWAQAPGCGMTDNSCAPDPVMYGRYARAMAAFYSKPENGGVHHWEIWNEPNQPDFWHNPNAVQYTGILKAAYAGIHAADPGATVLAGGSAGGGGGSQHIDPRVFLQTIYANGGGNSFDALAHHGYTWSTTTNRSSVNFNSPSWRMMYEDGVVSEDGVQGRPSLHQILKDHGDQARAIWLTEFGVKAPYYLKNADHTITEQDAAEYVKQVFPMWDSITSKNGTVFNTGPIFWFTYNFSGSGSDGEPYSMTRDSGSAPQCNGTSVDATPVAGSAAKPVFCAYKNYPRSTNTPPPPPPPDQAPTVGISAPAAGATLKETTQVSAHVSDDHKVVKADLYIDSNLKASKPVGLASADVNFFWDTRQVSNGSHTVTLKVYDNASHVTPASRTVNVQNAKNGLTGNYFNRAIFLEHKLTRVDPEIDFDWFVWSPDKSIDSNWYAVRWTGKVIPENSEPYTFYTRADDGTRLWINGRLVIDDWQEHSTTERASTTLSLTAGQQYDIKLEYYEANGASDVQLLWSSNHTPKAVIPRTNLRAN
jgi:hypothetical protein